MFQDKITAARSILEQFNSASPSNAIDIDKFVNDLTAAGGVSDDTLALLNWDDLKAMGLPLLIAKQVAYSFRKNETKTEVAKQGTVGPAYYNERQAARMTPQQLVGSYDPRDKDSQVAKRLKEMSGGKRFVVFNTDDSVDVVVTLKLLTELRDNFPERERYNDGKSLPRQVYSVGERPDALAEVNPLFPAEILRPGGEDANIGRSWASVPLKTKQLIYLARQNGELKVNDLRDAVQIHAEAIVDDGFNKIAAYCPNAATEFAEKEKRGELPSLKTAMPGSNSKSARQDPFFGGGSPHKRY